MGMDKKSYLTDGDVETVDGIIRDFLYLRGYIRTEGLENEIMYRKPRNNNEQVIITLGIDPKNKYNSILATVAFHQGIYGIEYSKLANDIRESVIFEITGRLISNTRSFEISETKDLSDPISAWANAEAYAPTNSKIPKIENVELSWEKVPISFQIILGVTFIALISVTVTYWTHFIAFSAGTYIVTTVGLIIALFVEIGIPLREELRSKQKAKQKLKLLLSNRVSEIPRKEPVLSWALQNTTNRTIYLQGSLLGEQP